MGFYEDKILPGLIDYVCSGSSFTELRKPLISSMQGVGLELGVGSGLNFPFYCRDKIKTLYILEPSEVTLHKALQQATEFRLPVEVVRYQGDYQLPIASNSLDFVITTWTLCTIENVVSTLKEVGRVLKKDGCYYFLEHGLAPNKPLAFCQHLLNPLQKSIGGGCNLNRDIFALIEKSGLTLIERKNFYMDAIKIGAYIYQGRAVFIGG